MPLVLVIVGVTLCPISYRPATGLPADVERAFVFAVLGGIISVANPKRRDLIISILLTGAFVALLEAGQNFVPSRNGDMHDFIIKVSSAITGTLAVWVVRRVHHGPDLS